VHYPIHRSHSLIRTFISISIAYRKHFYAVFVISGTLTLEGINYAIRFTDRKISKPMREKMLLEVLPELSTVSYCLYYAVLVSN